MNILNSLKGLSTETPKVINDIACERVMELSANCFMMADADLNIVHANPPVVQLLTERANEVRKAIPDFTAEGLVGKNIDIFHKNPAHQRGMLSRLSQPHTTQINVGSLTFKLTIIPMFDEQNQKLGYVVEWQDMTEFLVKASMLDALDKSQAFVQFNAKGEVITANKNFLQLMGYSLDEIEGKHHRMFLFDEDVGKHDYQDFWQKLSDGGSDAGEYRRKTKNGNEVWLNASYSPVTNPAGKVVGVVNYSTDVTEQSLKNADYAGQIEAIHKSQAVIEFNMDGTIRTANDNFCNAVGYSLSEIKGKHHRMFCESEYANSEDYRQFWATLNEGTHFSDEYKRVGKGGKEIWIQASYNPIFDVNGNPFKVVKYASDITGRKQAIAAVKDILLKLSDGDLTSKIDQSFEGEFQVLADAINSFIDDLTDTISNINDASSAISSAATQIATGNNDLSSRTEQQASSLEETASSMEELTGTVRLNSENASQANGLAVEASNIAVEGGEMINQVVDKMSSINESANKISEIIGVIDGIAFQTNILALNAAVEAARAGEQGRGFAVVASEVRSLAQRSADAAKDIKELISASVSQIEDGNALVNQSGETMEKIVTSIKRVNDIMSEIAAASKEQASGIDEVSQAVSQMDEVTQQNAALVEEAAAAAQSMQDQSEQLADRMAGFDLGEQPQVVTKATAKVVRKPRLKNQEPEEAVSNIIHSVKKATNGTAVASEWEDF